jgi:rare lipoprotein A
VLQVVQTVQDPAVVAVPAVPAPAVVEDVVEEEVSEGKQIGAGEASYYGNELAGNRTASGERFNPRALTAAHRTLPLGSKIRVTNLSNGKSVVVRINDRGPFVKSRLIDVSYAAAQQINMIRSGKARVRLALIA